MTVKPVQKYPRELSTEPRSQSKGNTTEDTKTAVAVSEGEVVPFGEQPYHFI